MIKKILKNKENWLYFIGVIFIISFILANNHISTVIADDNYSNYLYNQNLTVVNDRAMILKEPSYSGNNYRNYFESGFIFPAKLSSEMYNSFATDYTQYSFNQIYLNRLDNDYAFKSNNNSENVYNNVGYNNESITYNSGTYNNQSTYAYPEINILLRPSYDINTGWKRFPTTNNLRYDKVNDSLEKDTSDYIYNDLTLFKPTQWFGFENISSETYENYWVDKIEFRIYHRFFTSSPPNDCYMGIWLYNRTQDGSSSILLEYNQFRTGNYDQTKWNNHTFTRLVNETLNYQVVNNLAMRIRPVSAVGQNQRNWIYSIGLIVYGHIIVPNQVIDTYEYLEIEYERDIDYLTNETFKPIFFDLNMLVDFNISDVYLDVYIYDYDLEVYDYIFQLTNLTQETFRFNLSAYFRLNMFKLFINSSLESTIYFQTYFILMNLTITNVIHNELGFHDFAITYNRRDDGLVYRGYYQFRVKLYKTYFIYEYIEYNTETDNFLISWVYMNFSDTFDSIETFEINTHCRYGLNTLDIEITNIFIEIYINSYLYMDFLEQDRKYFNGKHYQTFFNYTCVNRNYLNLTGVYGNYSYNCLNGIRCLSGDDNLIFNRFFIVPLFQENIDITQRVVSQDVVDISGEPDAPKDANYWTYTSFRLAYADISHTEVGNWTIDFQDLEVEEYTAKYYYNPESISRRSLGDWRFKIGNDITGYLRFDFNFMRDAVAKIINVIILFFQYVFFLVVASLSFIFMFLGCWIVVILWNGVVWFLFIMLCWVLWYLVIALIYIWQLLVWVWENLLIPFFEWCWNVLVPLLVEWFIIIWAHIITFIIWILTFAQADYWEIYDVVYATLKTIVDFAIEILLVVIKHILVIIVAIVLYLILVLMCWLKHSYTKAKGYVNRTEQLRQSLDIYLVPINFVIDTAKKIYDILPIA